LAWGHPAEDLANRLAAAATEAERKALLSDEKDLISVLLRQALVTAAQGPWTKGDYPRALAIYETALDVARRIDDREGIAYLLDHLGDVYWAQGDEAKALECYDQTR